jgi:integrase
LLADNVAHNGINVSVLMQHRTQPNVETKAITLDALWNRYSRECETFLDNTPTTRESAEACVQRLKAIFGAHRDVRSLSSTDLSDYTKRRLHGGIRYQIRGERAITEPVGKSTAHRDLSTLRTMLRWARTVTTPDGERWLDQNPLEGMRFEKEKNPRRPVSTQDRYETTRAAVQRLAADAVDQRDRLRWMRLEFALFLAVATGRRRGALVGLRWEDFDFVTVQVTWRAEYDKKGVEWVIPMPPEFMAEVRQFQHRLGASSGFVFPSRRNPTGHIPADMLSQWLRIAEEHTTLPKLKGGLWHPYRRKWASERMHLPLKAVADAGGWKDVATLMKCYQHSDAQTLLNVMANRSPRHDPPSDPVVQSQPVAAEQTSHERPKLALVR